jgi:hypothetical protein
MELGSFSGLAEATTHPEGFYTAKKPRLHTLTNTNINFMSTINIRTFWLSLPGFL